MHLTCLELCTGSPYSPCENQIPRQDMAYTPLPVLSPATADFSLSQVPCKNCVTSSNKGVLSPVYIHLSLFAPNFFHFPSPPDSLRSIPFSKVPLACADIQLGHSSTEVLLVLCWIFPCLFHAVSPTSLWLPSGWVYVLTFSVASSWETIRCRMCLLTWVMEK